MKVLGLNVTSVRRNSARVVILKHIWFVMKVWSRMLAVSVQRVSIEHLSWKYISQNTQTSSSFGVVDVAENSNIDALLLVILTDVPVAHHLLMSNLSWQQIETENRISVQFHINRHVTGKTVTVCTRTSMLLVLEVTCWWLLWFSVWYRWIYWVSYHVTNRLGPWR